MSTRKPISAVLDEELAKFLESVGELNRVNRANAHCSVCGGQVTLETIRLVVPASKQVQYVCEKESCMLRYTLGE